MRVETEPSFPVSIFIAGDYDKAHEVCQAHCDEIGLCVTVSRTSYVYTNGSEDGVIVGFINYPRFPEEPERISAKAISLGMRLREELSQDSFSVQTPIATFWFSWRDASAGEAGTAATVKQGAVHEHATAESGDAQTPTPSSRERK